VRGCLAIARNTFRETVRARVLYVLVFFAVLIIFSSKAIGWVSVEQDVKIITDVGLAAIPFFSILIAIFVGTGLVYREIDKRTLYTILARPIRRETFVLGKYLGFLGAIFLVQTLMVVAFLVYLAVWSSLQGADTLAPVTGFSVTLVQAILLSYFEVALVTALAVFFSAVSTPILSAFFTFGAYAIGANARSILQIIVLSETEAAPGGHSAATGLVEFAYCVIPNLSLLNLRSEAVHGSGQAIPWDDVGLRAAYGLLYMTLVLIAAALAFRRRNL